MSFLFPWFMLGLGALAIPVILHLRRRPPTETVAFSTLMFLEKSPVRPRSRRKLEDWLLLLLRCLALVLLALMFSRPFFRSNVRVIGNQSRATVVLLDRSASMRNQAWKQALAKTGEALADLREADAAALVTFDDQPSMALSFEAWKGLAEGQRKVGMETALKKTAPGWGGTDLGKALISAVEMLGNQRVSAKRIILISDLQEGAALEALHGFAWPDDVQLILSRIEQPSYDNLSLSLAAVAEESGESTTVSGPAAHAALRVRVRNDSRSRVEKFALSWRGAPGDKIEASVPAGLSRVFTAPPRPEGAGDPVLDLTGDAVDFDNHLYFARAHPRKATILCVGSGLSVTEVASPLFYLARALKPSPLVEPMLLSQEKDKLTPEDLAKADYLILCGDLPAAAVENVKTWMQAGHSAVWVMAERDSGAVFTPLTGLGGSVKEASASNYAMLSELRFEHPILQPFADAGVRDFTKVRFWKHRVFSIAPTDLSRLDVVARYDDGSIAWAETAVGRGRLFLMTSGWQPSDSQLAVSSKFVPLMYALLDRAGLTAPQSHAYAVGEPIPVSEWGTAGTVRVKLPDGKTTTWDAAARGAFTETDQPGVYVFGEGDSAKPVAVNLAPGEGRLTPLDPQRLRSLGVRFSDASSAKAAHENDPRKALQLQDAERESRQKLWKWLALAVLAVLLIETWLAGRREARPQALPQPS